METKNTRILLRDLFDMCLLKLTPPKPEISYLCPPEASNNQVSGLRKLAGTPRKVNHFARGQFGIKVRRSNQIAGRAGIRVSAKGTFSGSQQETTAPATGVSHLKVSQVYPKHPTERPRTRKDGSASRVIKAGMEVAEHGTYVHRRDVFFLGGAFY